MDVYIASSVITTNRPAGTILACISGYRNGSIWKIWKDKFLEIRLLVLKSGIASSDIPLPVFKIH